VPWIHDHVRSVIIAMRGLKVLKILWLHRDGGDWDIPSELLRVVIAPRLMIFYGNGVPAHQIQSAFRWLPLIHCFETYGQLETEVAKYRTASEKEDLPRQLCLAPLRVEWSWG